MNKIKTIITLLLIACGGIFAESNSTTGLKFNPIKSKVESGIQRNEKHLKVLAVMVDFQVDTLKSTTGNGKFNSGYNYPDSLKIDAVPHDSAYFFQKLKFVRNYFNSVSNGNVDFPMMKILPQIVTLNQPIWYYNYNNGESDFAGRRLTELHKRVWAAARLQISEAELAQYNSFVIFHAGSGQEFSLEYDETPFDIPSVYLDEAELIKYGAGDPIINNSIILPECEWQVSDVRKNPKWHFASMNGAMVLMFAHKLGLPNLYSSKDNKSGVGRFDLMDQGGGNFSGLIPAGPSAWCREYLGWSNVKNLDNYHGQNRIPLALNSDVYKLDVDRNEYLLMEYRRAQNVSQDTAYGYDAIGNKVARFFKKDYREKIEVINPSAVITNIGDKSKNAYYDFAIPASGTFIWHVDKRLTTPELVKNNKVNENYNNRGVYLEEADGSFDIGKKYWLLDAGYGTELGWTYDAFFDSNRVWREHSNKELYTETQKVAFSTRSYPTADNNSGIPINIQIADFTNPSKNDTVYFSFKRTAFSPEFALENCGRNFQLFYHQAAGNDYSILNYPDSIRIKSVNGNQDTTHVFAAASQNNFLHAYSDRLYRFNDISNSTLYQRIDLSSCIVTNLTLPSNLKTPLQVSANLALTDSGLYNLDSAKLDRNWKNMSKLVVHQFGGDQYLMGYLRNDSVFVYSGSIPVNPEEIGNYHIGRKLGGLSSAAEMKLVLDAFNQPVAFIVIDGQTLYTVSAGSENNDVEKTVLSGRILGITDADHDGKIEVIVDEDNQTLLKNQFGVTENGFPVNYSSINAQPASLLSYKRNSQSILLTADTLGVVHSFFENGDQNRSLHQVIPVGENVSTQIDLISRDQSVYLSLARRDLGSIQYYNLGSGLLDPLNDLPGLGWSSSLGRTIRLSAKTAISDNRLFKNGAVYNWPNPAKGDHTNFRFFLTSPATVKVTIYDLTGMKIANLSQSFGNYGDYCELNWNLNGIASGIYLAAVTVSDGQKSESYKVKVAVAK